MAVCPWERSTVARRMEERIREDRLDVDAWRVLLTEAAAQSPADFRPTFEAAVTAMPLCAPVWMRWIEAEINAGDAAQVEAIFELCLLRCPQLPLWQALASVGTRDSSHVGASSERVPPVAARDARVGAR